jgi:threonine dehydrogenase-like Zn-dependent dehydrogenase
LQKGICQKSGDSVFIRKNEGMIMTAKFEDYRDLKISTPVNTWAWNMYGAGIENIGRDGRPELFPVPQPNDDQLLVRVDAVGMCFSDVKLIKQGGAHPKLYNRDLKNDPTRLGHEATLTVIKVGKNLSEKFHTGQRLAIQPDIYHNQMSTAYGYTIPGGLTQYHLVGDEILNADDGSYVIPVEGYVGYAEAALTEPWACVEAAYTQRRRLNPLKGGLMWILGQQGDTTAYSFSGGLESPVTIILSDVPEALKKRVQEETRRGAKVIEINGLKTEDFPKFNAENSGDKGFDDIVLLEPKSAALVTEAAKLVAYRGSCNIVGKIALDGNPQIDAGRIHYHYTTYIGNPGPDIAASYGEKRNRAELRTGGSAVFVGAGGPMGQMHVQRAIELENGPAIIIASEVNPYRMETLEKLCSPLAHARGKKFITFNPSTAGESVIDFVKQQTDGRMADDVVVSVPIATLMEESGKLTAPDGMLVFFAGVAIGTYVSLNMSAVYLHNAQLTGTSGSTLDDQRLVIQKTLTRQLSPNLSVAAVGGLEAARDGVDAMMNGKFAGKVVIFPQLSGLPLTGLEEMPLRYPEIAAKLGPNNTWTLEAEKALIEKFWTGA